MELFIKEYLAEVRTRPIDHHRARGRLRRTRGCQNTWTWVGEGVECCWGVWCVAWREFSQWKLRECSKRVVSYFHFRSFSSWDHTTWRISCGNSEESRENSRLHLQETVDTTGESVREHCRDLAEDTASLLGRVHPSVVLVGFIWFFLLLGLLPSIPKVAPKQNNLHKRFCHFRRSVSTSVPMSQIHRLVLELLTNPSSNSRSAN